MDPYDVYNVLMGL